MYDPVEVLTYNSMVGAEISAGVETDIGVAPGAKVDWVVVGPGAVSSSPQAATRAMMIIDTAKKEFLNMKPRQLGINGILTPTGLVHLTASNPAPPRR